MRPIVQSFSLLALLAIGTVHAVESAPILINQAARASVTGEYPDCTQCHEEVIPFNAPEICGIGMADKCWHRRRLSTSHSARTEILERDRGTPGLLYRFRGERLVRYFLPADPKVRNPHFNLNE